MALHEIDDLALPNFICGNARVIVKFTAEGCAICEKLAPFFQDLSNQEYYSNIKFLKMDAKENLVANKQVKSFGGTPFMVTYRNGVLETYKLVTNEADIMILINNLN